jgi:hypothetical protein
MRSSKTFILGVFGALAYLVPIALILGGFGAASIMTPYAGLAERLAIGSILLCIEVAARALIKHS